MTKARLALSAALVAAAAILGAGAGGAWAQGRPVEVYRARLSEHDHYNSDGERLTTVAAIIRQDRANFHRYDMRDPEDEGDDFFDSPVNRQRLEVMLLNGHVTRHTQRAILRDDPLVEVTVYNNYVDLEIIE